MRATARSTIRAVLLAVVLAAGLGGCELLDSLAPSTAQPGLPSPSIEIPPPR